MNRQAAEVVEIAKALGFAFEGYDGKGHVVLALPNGQRTSIPATPGEYRGRRNAIAALERLSGRKLARPNHRRSRKSFATGPDPEVEAARRRHASEFEERAIREAQRANEIRAIQAAERRRREIEELMR